MRSHGKPSARSFEAMTRKHSGYFEPGGFSEATATSSRVKSIMSSRSSPAHLSNRSSNRSVRLRLIFGTLRDVRFGLLQAVNHTAV
jgi:hypothetical protein